MPDIPGWNIAKYPLTTPDSPSGDFICRLIRVPQNSSWSALVSGVLSLLMCPENFEVGGTATRGETVQIFSEMFEEYVPLMNDLIGTVIASTVAVIPDTQLLCDGSQYLRVDYPELYDKLDPVFIVDADNFVVPDLRERNIIGVQPEVMGAVGGSDDHILTVNQLAPHEHFYDKFLNLIIPTGVEFPNTRVIPATLPTPTTTTGLGEAVNHQDQFLALNYVIIAKC